MLSVKLIFYLTQELDEVQISSSILEFDKLKM